MEKDDTKALALFLKQNFDFKALKQAGFYDDTIRPKDHQAQAHRICQYFGLRSVYDYGRLGAGTRYHLSEAEESQAIPLFTKTIPKHAFADNILKAIGFQEP